MSAPLFSGQLADVVLLNRAVYGTVDDLAAPFLRSGPGAGDPAAVGPRLALSVFDRYDLFLAGEGFRTLSSAELGFAPGEVSASDGTAGLDRHFTYSGDLYRNNFRELPSGAEVPAVDAGAVALAAVKDGAAPNGGDVLHLVFRGTDADVGADGEAATGPGQVRYYQQLQAFIDQAYAFAADPANGVGQVVVSGHSLGGTMADLFALYDGARFDALPGVDLQVVSLASAGVDPLVFALAPDFDRDLVTLGSDGRVIGLATPDWYGQYDHAGDIVRNTESYDRARHAQLDPEQAAVTGSILPFLAEHLHFESNRLSVETPLVDQYAISRNFDTTFLSLHYAALYESIGTELADAAKVADPTGFDRVVALNGINPRDAETPGSNDPGGWNLSVDDRFVATASRDDLFVIGMEGGDTVRAGSGDDALFGGAGRDWLFGGAGDDILVGGSDRDVLDGGQGYDIAVFEGRATDYRIATRADGATQVIDLAGDGGIDLLRSIEEIRFLADGDPLTV